jgi:N-acetylglucosamine transport system substrate-binding protein
MIALCREIRKSGLAPWTYQGKHARYMSWPILAAAAKLGGVDVLKAIDNLEPNAWKQDAVRQAADAYSQLAVDGFIQRGAEGMDHVQAQTEWCRGKAAFISCGSWLENEQKAVTPPGFRMAVGPTPSLTSGDKLPFEAFRGTGSEPFVVPAKAKNVRGGLEYLRVMLSQKAASDFTRKVSSLTCVTGAGAGLELSPGLTSVTKLIDAGGGDTFTWLYSSYYRKLERSLVDAACADLFTKRINAAQWADQCQRGADEIARDASIKKYKRS